MAPDSDSREQAAALIEAVRREEHMATQAHDMTPVFELAGFCATEALRKLGGKSDLRPQPGEPGLLPFLVIQDPSGKRAFVAFDAATPENFAKVIQLLDRFTPSDKFAVLAKDGYATIDDSKTDAVILEAHRLVVPRHSFCIVVPYRPSDGTRSFRISGPRIVAHDGFDIRAVDAIAAFARGRDRHPQSPTI
jgi:hypothetical protein